MKQSLRLTGNPLSTMLSWHDGFLLGHEPMDDMHEECVALVGKLIAAADEGLMPALTAVLEHTVRHFGDEDRWMTETGFPARQCHMDEHAAVLASMEAVRARVANGDLDAGRRLADALVDWLPAHLDYLDAPLAHWMCKRRLGGKPVVVRRQITANSHPVDG